MGHGFFGFLERALGGKAADTSNDLLKLQQSGQTGYDYGTGVTQEGLAGLRTDLKTYGDRVSDPLGATGRGIFSRALGGINDTATRTQRAFGARISQLAAQNGGTLSPEAQAELQSQNARDVEQQRFDAQNQLTNSEAGMTLSETGKLFDRMDSIRKSIVGVGQDEKTRGLQAIIAALSGRTQRSLGIAQTTTSAFAAAG